MFLSNTIFVHFLYGLSWLGEHTNFGTTYNRTRKSQIRPCACTGSKTSKCARPQRGVRSGCCIFELDGHFFIKLGSKAMTQEAIDWRCYIFLAYYVREYPIDRIHKSPRLRSSWISARNLWRFITIGGRQNRAVDPRGLRIPIVSAGTDSNAEWLGKPVWLTFREISG